MKNKLCVFVLLAISMAAGSQAFSYSRAYEMTASMKVELKEYEDFVRYAKNSKSREIIVSDEYFAIIENSCMYVLRNNGYYTLEDYLIGKNSKYPNGRLFYLARENALKTPEEAMYFDNELFINGDDYRKALAGGFIGSGKGEVSKNLYGLLRKVDIQKRIKVLYWLFYNMTPRSSYESLKAMEGLTQDQFDEISASKIKKVIDDVYLVQFYVSKPTDYYRPSGTSTTKIAAYLSDAYVYYIAQLCGYDSYASYLKRDIASPIVITSSILENMHMKSLAEIQEAAAHGFNDGDEYRKSTFYGIANYSDYNTNLESVKKLERIRSQFGLVTRETTAIAYYLIVNPDIYPISIDQLCEKINIGLRQDPVLSFMKLTHISVSYLESFFRDCQGILKIISYSQDKRVVERK